MTRDNSTDDEEQTERWTCGDCGYEDSGPVGELVGRPIKKTVGDGRREKVIETVVCPECKSENWHSAGVRAITRTVDAAAATDEGGE